jgi:hypothetical protein
MKKYRISKLKLYELLKPAIPSKPLNENEVQNELTDNELVALVLIHDTSKYVIGLTTKGYLKDGKITKSGEAILNEKIERLKKLL